MAEFLKVLCTCKDWERTVSFTECNKLQEHDLIFIYFYFNALYNLKRYEVIGSVRFGHMAEFFDVPCATTEAEEAAYQQHLSTRSMQDSKKLQDLQAQIKAIPGLLFILGKSYNIAQNRRAASACFRACLERDALAIDAIQELVRHRLLSQSDILTYLDEAAEKSDLNETERKLFEMARLYIDDYELTERRDEDHLDLEEPFYKHPATRATIANELFKRGDAHKAHEITSQLMKEEGLIGLGLLVHIGTLVQLGRASDLYCLAHNLVKKDPDNDVAWYAVGCYYYVVNARGDCKIFLNKCTTMNPSFGEAWIMFGHILTTESEHEHALSCYQRAGRLVEHSFEPHLYIGLEHSYANNLSVATGHLKDAASISGNHAIVLQEQGVLLYHQEQTEDAYCKFIEALQSITGYKDTVEVKQLLNHHFDEFWEPLINNLGHAARRLNHYEEALLCFRKSLLIWPRNESALAALSATACSADKDLAIQFAHEALVENPTDPIMKQLLKTFIEETAVEDDLDVWSFDGSEDLESHTMDILLNGLKSNMSTMTIGTPEEDESFVNELGRAKKSEKGRRPNAEPRIGTPYNTRSHARAQAAANVEEDEPVEEAEQPESMES
ncbi:hypothetical protein L596_006398 [Steinernema carpocapsae]|uniref:Uncharacterized protein n=1 Tax=Steinernema carpocapsae TaxID=34508 RepID=A0A4U8V221_STECR|nr:hypothetical protein L596_006398 [Steinernema carpocapsae]